MGGERSKRGKPGASLRCVRHPAATGGGFGLAPWENPGPRPPKAGAALSPTGQGKFRRGKPGSPKFVAAPRGSFFVARIRHLTSVLAAKG